MAKHFSKVEKEEIKLNLIKVGATLFQRYGLDKVSINDLTQKAGIGKGTFYLFYNSKADLFMEIYQRERERVWQDIYEKHKDIEGEISSVITDYIYEQLEVLNANPILDLVYELHTLGMISDKSVKSRLTDYNVVRNAELAELIQHWFNKHGIVNIKPEVVVGMIRSVYFIQFHEKALGSEVFENIQGAIIASIGELFKN